MDRGGDPLGHDLRGGGVELSVEVQEGEYVH
jgi:hypothetical protein